MNIRPSEPDDFEPLVELMARVFKTKPDVPFLSAPTMRWKYWDRRPDCALPRSYILEGKGRIYAHLGVWPAVVEVGGVARQCGTPIDWVGDRAVPGAGGQLIQHLNDTYDFAFVTGATQAARALMPRLGFRNIGQSWRAALPVHPWRMALEPAYYKWSLPARILRNAAWSALRPRSGIVGWSYEPANADELPALADHGTEIRRQADFFRHLARCPGLQCHLYRVLHEGVPRGFFMLMKVRHHMRASVWLENPVPQTLRAAYSLAAQAAGTHRDVLELVIMGSTPGTAETAAQAGFKIRSTSPLWLLDRNDLWTGAQPAISFQLADFDATFYDDGAALALC